MLFIPRPLREHLEIFLNGICHRTSYRQYVITNIFLLIWTGYRWIIKIHGSINTFFIYMCPCRGFLFVIIKK